MKTRAIIVALGVNPAGKSVIHPLLEPFEHNLGQKKLNQKAIPAQAGAYF